MRNPFEFITDLYDYHFQYYRWFFHRRLIFSEISPESLKNDFKFNIFENNDSENVGKLVKQTALVGFSFGLGVAPIKIIMMKELQKKTFRQALPAAIGVVALGTGIGLAYGAIVNATSNFRGQKNDATNHVVASLATFPAIGVYARSNKIQWGILNSFVIAGFMAFLKYSYSGNFVGVNPSKQFSNLTTSITPSHYKVN